MGVYFDGFHHRVAHGIGQGLYLCRHLSTDEVHTFLFHIRTLYSSTGGRAILQGDL